MDTKISDKHGAYVFRVEVTCALKMEKVNFSKLWNYIQDCLVSWTGGKSEYFETELGS